jgi:formylglycine-generating enzyme required for sulfatase activity
VPVVHITLAEAKEYAAWAGLRLPTEAEWERAASWDGKKKRRCPWGDEDASTARAHTLDIFGGENRLGPVTDFPDQASPVGALNMAGNARERVLDRYVHTLYKERVARGRVVRDPCEVGRPGDMRHVIRGGSFRELGPAVFRTHLRMALPAERVSDELTGFRVALSEDGSPRPRLP